MDWFDCGSWMFVFAPSFLENTSQLWDKKLLYRGTIIDTLKGELILFVYSYSVLIFLVLVWFNWRTLFFEMQKLLYHGTINGTLKGKLNSIVFSYLVQIFHGICWENLLEVYSLHWQWPPLKAKLNVLDLQATPLQLLPRKI